MIVLGTERYRRALRVWDGAVRLTGGSAGACALGRFAACWERRRMCRRGLHDLTDPANLYRFPSMRGTACRPCQLERKRAYRNEQRALRAGGPPAERTYRATGAIYARVRGPLAPAQLARLRAIAACRSCGAVPTEGADGRVRIPHRSDCRGVIDPCDAPRGVAS